MSEKIVLMSSPDYFKVEYSINPWMIPGTTVDLELSKNQWNGLKRTIEEAGAEVKVVPPNENHPDLVLFLLLQRELCLELKLDIYYNMIHYR